MTPIYVSGFLAIVLFLVVGLGVVDVLEWKRHRSHCLCQTCKDWREKQRELGKEP